MVPAESGTTGGQIYHGVDGRFYASDSCEAPSPQPHLYLSALCTDAIDANKGRWKCNQCGETFSQLKNFRRHYRQFHEFFLMPCSQCGRTFSRSDKLRNHLKKIHGIGFLSSEGVESDRSPCTGSMPWVALYGSYFSPSSRKHGNYSVEGLFIKWLLPSGLRCQYKDEWVWLLDRKPCSFVASEMHNIVLWAISLSLFFLQEWMKWHAVSIKRKKNFYSR